MTLRFRAKTRSFNSLSAGSGFTLNLQSKNLQPSLWHKSAVSGPRRMLAVSPVLRVNCTHVTLSSGYSLYPEYTTLRYFSYVIAIIQRSGKRLSYWRLGAEVVSSINQLIFTGYGLPGLESRDIETHLPCSDDQVNEGKTYGVSEGEVNSPHVLDHPTSQIVSSIVYTLWLRSRLIELTPATQVQTSLELYDNISVFLRICQRVRVSFLVRYRSLDRKLRKIVKNKYRYSRSYVMLKPSSRVKQGLRFILLGLSLRSNQKIRECLASLFYDVLFAPQSSILLEVRDKYQSVALTALTLNR